MFRHLQFGREPEYRAMADLAVDAEAFDAELALLIDRYLQ